MCDTVGIGGKCAEVRVKVDLINFLVDLQDRVNLDIPRIVLKSLHKRNGQLFTCVSEEVCRETGWWLIGEQAAEKCPTKFGAL